MRIAVSGGFDPIHIGHLRMFKAAAKLGKLCVILNNDSFLKRKKGYIFMPLEDRAEIISSFRCVKEIYISPDKDDTVCASLRLIKPGIFCNGGDRKKDNIPEYEVCKELGIKMVFNVGGGKVRSSSTFVNKLLK